MGLVSVYDVAPEAIISIISWSWLPLLRRHRFAAALLMPPLAAVPAAALAATVWLLLLLPLLLNRCMLCRTPTRFWRVHVVPIDVLAPSTVGLLPGGPDP